MNNLNKHCCRTKRFANCCIPITQSRQFSLNRHRCKKRWKFIDIVKEQIEGISLLTNRIARKYRGQQIDISKRKRKSNQFSFTFIFRNYQLFFPCLLMLAISLYFSTIVLVNKPIHQSAYLLYTRAKFRFFFFFTDDDKLTTIETSVQILVNVVVSSQFSNE